ncbi:MAG TPA: FtsX-like permease family protein, partial [Verrucomicrobiae bacterium]|nr:FtsX-like permease family protein [Verrucomicrobiae bacterium]
GLTYGALGQQWQIVGVCKDSKYDDIKKAPQPVTFFPYRQMFLTPSLSKNLGITSLAVRTTLTPPAFSSAIRQAVAQVDPDVAVTSVTTQKEMRDRGISRERMLATLCSVLAALALLLACVGLYGLMAYNVARRTSEIAIRMAIGARPADVAGPVLREALTLAAIGIGLGLLGALASTKLIQNQLYGVPPNDPATLTAVSITLVIVAILAAWLPARRATRVDPLIALRSE